MAKHEFGIMRRAPMPGERYDVYLPEKCDSLIAADDIYIEKLQSGLEAVDTFYHTLDVAGKGLAYCGVTLIPPEAAGQMADIVKDMPELKELEALLETAEETGRYVIHYGL